MARQRRHVEAERGEIGGPQVGPQGYPAAALSHLAGREPGQEPRLARLEARGAQRPQEERLRVLV